MNIFSDKSIDHQEFVTFSDGEIGVSLMIATPRDADGVEICLSKVEIEAALTRLCGEE